MTQSKRHHTANTDNHLQQYVKEVRGVHEKFGAITEGKKEIVRSLTQAAETLRAMAVPRRMKSNRT